MSRPAGTAPAGADARGGVVPLAPRLAGAAARRPLPWRGTLLIGPGGRWRLAGSVPGRDAEGGAAEGYDGERGWSWRSSATDGPPPLPVKVNGAYPPVPELLCPSCLLGGYTLEELGPVTVAGRDAIAVAATPRRDVLGSGPGHWSHDRVEVAVDAELGILLRRIETSGGAVRHPH